MQLSDITTAIVRASAAGRTVLHELGWRAERIRIEEIWAPGVSGDLLETLHRQFGVPVHLSFPKRRRR
jgi:hypothetical protein